MNAGALRQLYLTPRLVAGVAGAAVLFVLGYFWSPLAGLAWIVLGALALAAGLETLVLLRTRGGVEVARKVPARFSNGDPNPVTLALCNTTGGRLDVRVVEELPPAFGLRGYGWRVQMGAGETRTLEYTVRPTQRGRYLFGLVNAYASTSLGLVQRRYQSSVAHEVAVYPSFLYLEKYQLAAATSNLQPLGVRKMRRLGHTLEFEHVRDYTVGDDVRAVNWRATARRGHPMVNQYQDERAQPIYAILDMGRLMKMPFDGLTLLDHSINAALALAAVAIKKGDMSGVVAYASRIHLSLRAERRQGQMHRILEALYALQPEFDEADSERLYAALHRDLPRRSLLVLFTNFESVSGMKRHLPALRGLARRHVVVCILFENTELRALAAGQPERLDALYVQTIARQFGAEKREIARTLRQHGVGTLYTTPATLTLDVMGRYLELKAQGVI